jgi:hypothetical protein
MKVRKFITITKYLPTLHSGATRQAGGLIEEGIKIVEEKIKLHCQPVMRIVGSPCMRDKI